MKRLFLVLIIMGVIIAGCDSNGDETPDIPTTPDTITPVTITPVTVTPDLPTPPAKITFGDANLEEAVYEELNIPGDRGITPEDLKDLTSLEVNDKKVNDLSGLEYCTNLQTLNLHHNSIVDISPLASLTNLQKLNLYENSIVDISPLVSNNGLSNGDRVNISGNPLSDTSLNKYIPQLEERGVSVGWK